MSDFLLTQQAPTPEYQALQSELRGRLIEGCQGNQKLQDSLEHELCARFRLEPTNSKNLHRFTDKYHSSLGLDHTSRYSYFGVLWVFISQPYHMPCIKLARQMGLEVVNLTNWAFYYPGEAFCLAYVGKPKLINYWLTYNTCSMSAEDIFVNPRHIKT